MDFNNLSWADDMIDNLLSQIRKETNVTEEEWDSKVLSNKSAIIDSFIATFISTFPDFIREKQIQTTGLNVLKFEERLRSDYKEAFEHLDTFSFLFNHFGIEYFKAEGAKSKNPNRVFTLRRLFFRGIQINNEIFHLIKGGFPYGAIGRWRTLHEVSIVYVFLKNGDDNLIEMYNDYQAVEKYKRAKALMSHYELLNWPSPSDIVKELADEVERLKDKYGKEYTKDYGWTMTILPSGKRSISGIEEYVNLNYLRSFYSYASDDIHAGISALQRDNEISFETLIDMWGGRSLFGYIDPVQLTTNTLCEMFCNLTSDVDTLGNHIYRELIIKYHTTVVSAFEKCETELKRRIKESNQE